MTAPTIRAGIGGWVFAPWEGTFYPDDLPKKQQLQYAGGKLSTIEINGTYYRGQTPATFARWAADVPDGFVFSVKGNRFVTNRTVLAQAEGSLAKFFATGITELGEKLGPILWQLAPTKTFDPDDFDAFLDLLPTTGDGIRLRHAVEVRHPSFAVPQFVALARKHGVAIVYAEHHTYPAIADVTADFVYVRLQKGADDVPTAYAPEALQAWAARAKQWRDGGTPADLPLADPQARPQAKPRDVFIYFIHEGKARAPQAAMALMEHIG